MCGKIVWARRSSFHVPRFKADSSWFRSSLSSLHGVNQSNSIYLGQLIDLHAGWSIQNLQLHLFIHLSQPALPNSNRHQVPFSLSNCYSFFPKYNTSNSCLLDIIWIEIQFSCYKTVEQGELHFVCCLCLLFIRSIIICLDL